MNNSIFKIEDKIRNIRPNNLVSLYPYNALNKNTVVNTKKKIELVYKDNNK